MKLRSHKDRAAAETVPEYLARIGAKGGSVKGPTKARTTEQARKAARARWGTGNKPMRANKARGKGCK